VAGVNVAGIDKDRTDGVLEIWLAVHASGESGIVPLTAMSGGHVPMARSPG